MDIDFHLIDGPTPVSPVFFNPWNSEFIGDYQKKYDQIVPVIFIKNKVFGNISKPEADTLIKKVSRKLNSFIQPQRFGEAKKVFSMQELQIDCDWTPSTKEIYFYFLDQLKKQLKIKITATIRVSQIRDRMICGIPPVDKGLLMAYNIDPVQDFDTENSIVNIDKLKKYLSKTDKYPVALDLAIPCFHWMPVFENQKLVCILKENTAQTLASVLKKEKNNSYSLTTDTVLENHFLRKGFIIRNETVTKKEMIEIAETVKEFVSGDSIRVLFFDFHRFNELNPTKNDVEDIISRLR
jgi:hypothetical protein